MPISILIIIPWNPSDGGVRTGGGLSIPQHFCSLQLKTKNKQKSPKTAWGGEEEQAPVGASSPGRVPWVRSEGRSGGRGGAADAGQKPP